MRICIVHAAPVDPPFPGRAGARPVRCASVAAIVWSREPRKPGQSRRRYV